MPAFVHNVKIVENANGSTINTGDAFLIAPTSSSKTHFGSGVSNTGDAAGTLNLFSKTKVDDQDTVDSSLKKAGTKA